MKGDRRPPAPSPSADLDAVKEEPFDLSILDGDGGTGGWDPAKPIGKGNPPSANSWKKGCPSPNPKGAPRKTPAGPYSVKLGQKIEGSNLTMGQALDRKIRMLALQGSVRANKLLHARLAREEEIARRRAEFEEYERKKAEHAKRRPASFEEFEAGQLFLDMLDRLRPGLLASVLEAQKLGLVEFRDGQYVIVEGIETYLQSEEE